MLGLDQFSDIPEIVSFTDTFDADMERKKVEWLTAGLSPQEVDQIQQAREGTHPGTGVSKFNPGTKTEEEDATVSKI